MTQPTDRFNTPIESALDMARRDFRVLPLKPGSKEPFAKDRGDDPFLCGGVNLATTDPRLIKAWFAHDPTINYGIAAGNGLVLLDADVKHASFAEDLLLLDYPKTLETETWSGGAHIYLGVDFDAGQAKLAGAPSIDVRARGGYVVGPGSVVNGKPYRIVIDAPVAACPPELASRISRRDKAAPEAPRAPLCDVDLPAARIDGWRLVMETPPMAESEGIGRNNMAHLLAGKIKRAGCSPEVCLEMVEYWNERCHPPQPVEDVKKTVESCYTNGDWRIGADRPEAEFKPIDGAPTVKPAAPATSIIRATPYKWRNPAEIPPRDWVYRHHLCRKFVSATFAPTKTGKSSLVLVELLSIVTGRGLLLPEGATAPRRGLWWYWNGEDPYDELQRRIQAACLLHGISKADLDGRLFTDSGRVTPMVIAGETRDGTVIAAPLVDAIKATIREHGLDGLTIDPFVSCHRVSENDNNKIEAVAWEWAKIADECNCAIELVHHVRKTGGAEITVEDGRGASALLGKVRDARVLNYMSEEEAKLAGIDSRRLYFRVDGVGNMAPPTDAAEWYRLASVDLGNATGERPSDSMGVVARWGSASGGRRVARRRAGTRTSRHRRR